MSYEDFKTKLEDIKSSIDPVYLLNSLGIKFDRDSYKEIRATCPIHGGDNKTSFRFNKDRKTWACFTRKCHEDFGNDIVGLVKAVTGRSFIDAVSYLQELVGDSSGADMSDLLYKKDIDEFVRLNNYEDKKPKSVNQQSLDKFKHFRSDFFLRQGFQKSTLDYFEVAGGWKDNDGVIRDIIPIRNDIGDLSAYSLRDIRSTNYDNKYIITPGFNKANCLYNLNNAAKFLKDKPLIIVEGFKSVWKLYEHGIYNVAAVMGSSMSEGQQHLALMYALGGVVIMFDNDIAGVSGAVKAAESLSGKMNVYTIFIQETDDKGKGLDPADLTYEQINSYIGEFV